MLARRGRRGGSGSRAGAAWTGRAASIVGSPGPRGGRQQGSEHGARLSACGTGRGARSRPRCCARASSRRDLGSTTEASDGSVTLVGQGRPDRVAAVGPVRDAAWFIDAAGAAALEGVDATRVDRSARAARRRLGGFGGGPGRRSELSAWSSGAFGRSSERGVTEVSIRLQGRVRNSPQICGRGVGGVYGADLAGAPFEGGPEEARPRAAPSRRTRPTGGGSRA